ncbi:MAG: hypothetical protein K2W96_19100 [Gemmataceae bacterium]|nr:hypothetical protein [Gemmataceae bacterium]
MSDLLAIEEIEKRYDGNWVLLGDLVSEEGPRLLAARVLFASADRDAVYAKLGEMPTGGHYGFHYCGEIGKGLEFVL